MQFSIFLLFFLFIPFSSMASAGETAPVSIQEGALDPVVCISSGTLSVRSDDLVRVLFSVKRGDPVKVFQGWGDVKKSRVIGGVAYQFSKMQFPGRQGTDVGWVAENYIRLRSQCPELENNGDEEEGRPITGLNDPRCCEFPLGNRPRISYSSGTPSFGSSRSGGARKHAASDLYGSKGDAIHAVADGKVIRGLYYFYQGTYAIEVKHPGGFVVRYGEVGSKGFAGEGKSVKAGDTVGAMGKTDCCQPMLHFELYSGSRSGPLSVSGNVYQRRADILNPTAYLQGWQDNAFRDRR